MLYSGVDGNGRQYVALAWSAEVGVATDPTHVPGGVLFAGHTAPALSPGAAGSWDDDAATIGKIRLRPTSQAPFPLFDLYYAGGSQPRNACAGGAMGCWSLGSAVSSDGLTFDKTVENPVTPRELFDSFTQAPPVTLLHPVVVDDTSMSGDTHAKIYLTRVTNGGGTPDTTERDVFLAYTEPGPVAPAPSLEPPRIRIGAPRGFYGLTGVPLAIYLADPLGSDPSRNGVETWSLRVLVDGGPLNGPLLRGPRLVTALRTPAASVTGSLTGIPDGTHTLEVSIRDLDGNEASASTSFTVDTVAPATTVTQSPQGTRMGYPFGIIGVFYGRSVEPAAGAGVNRIEVLVTDPLGRRERFPVLERQITRVDATTWSWRWSAPFDSHFAVPGTYEISFLASDAAGNREGPSPDNTVEVFVV